MKVIVDANIIFSAILNSNGKIGDILLNSGSKVTFIAPEFLRTEISKHHSKLEKISRLSAKDIKESEFQIYRNIVFISEYSIQQSVWESAKKLVSDIDPKDIPYVTFAKQFKCKIWRGDKALMKGLAKKGSRIFITTEDFFERLNKNKLYYLSD